MTCSYWRWVFLLARTFRRLTLFVSRSKRTLISNMSWIRRWRSPQHTRSYIKSHSVRHCLVFWRNICYHIVHWFVFLCQKYAVTLLELCLFKMEKDSSWGYCTADCRFFKAEFVIFFVIYISFFWCSCIEAPICTTITVTVKHMFEGNLTCLTQLFSFPPIIFYHIPPIFLDLESICFGAPTSLIPTFIEDGKYVLSYNLHAVGGICKKWWLWDLLIKFSFGCFQNFTPDIYWWMLEHSSYWAIVVTDDDINDEKSIIECILYYF